MEFLKVKPPIDHPTVTGIFQAVSNDSSFNIIMTLNSSSNKHNSFTLKRELNLSTKQFYFAISNLSNQGIVKRTNRDYMLTSFGKVIVNSVGLIEDAIKIYSKIKAIEVVQASQKVTKDEIHMLVDVLIDNERLKEIVKLRYSL